MSTEEVFRSLESKLRALRAELTAALDLAADAANVVELDQSRVGRLSRMDAMNQQAMAQATRSRNYTELRRIDAAIGRCESGRYGVCCRCQHTIDIERLQSDPAAPFCLSCLEEMSEDRDRGRGVR